MITTFEINRRLNGIATGTAGSTAVDESTRFRVYPLALAALAVSAAGGAAQMVGQHEAASARSAAVGAENRRQKGYRDQAAAVANQSIAESGRDTADPAIANAADERAARFNAIVNQAQAPTTGNTLNRALPSTTGTSTAAPGVSASAAAWNKILGGAQARLGGYSDWGLARNIAAKRAGQKLETIGTNARHSADLLAADLQDAEGAGENWNLAGSVLGALGAVGGAYAATAPAASAAFVPGVGRVAGTAGVDYAPRMLPWGSLPA